MTNNIKSDNVLNWEKDICVFWGKITKKEECLEKIKFKVTEKFIILKMSNDVSASLTTRKLNFVVLMLSKKQNTTSTGS